MHLVLAGAHGQVARRLGRLASSRGDTVVGIARVRLDRRVERGSIPRDDVAAVLLALLDVELDGVVLEVVGGPTPVAEAVAAIG